MQPYRIEDMAKMMHADSALGIEFDWTEMSADYRATMLARASVFAAALLGGQPTVEIQHGVRTASGKVHGPYTVAQNCFDDWEQVQREKIVYPAAAFVTPWVKPDPATEPRRPSSAVSARYTANCPTCGARGASKPGARDGEPCRAKSGRVTDTHEARIDAEWG